MVTSLKQSLARKNKTGMDDIGFEMSFHGVQHRMISVDNFFLFFEIIIFYFVVAI